MLRALARLLRRRGQGPEATGPEATQFANVPSAGYPSGWEPGHFYSPIPNVADVETRAGRIFDQGSPSVEGVDLNLAGQLDLLRQLRGHARSLQLPAQRSPDFRYFAENPNFQWGEAGVLQSMLRHLRPRRIVEVGSGYSSALILDVAERFLDPDAEVTFVEPYPDLLRSLLRPRDFDRVALHATPVQDVDLAVFTSLGPGDVLFIDSSHVSKTGSDVNALFFDILPRIGRGVSIHLHDIYYPFEYPIDWVRGGRTWNEAYLLRAFLMFNGSFQITCFPSFLFAHAREELLDAVPDCGHGPGSSLWMKRL